MHNDTVCDLISSLKCSLTSKDFLTVVDTVNYRLSLNGLPVDYSLDHYHKSFAKVSLEVSKNRKVHELAKKVLELI